MSRTLGHRRNCAQAPQQVIYDKEVKELAKVRLQFTSANLEQNGSVPESPASIKSFITPKLKIGCKKYLQSASEALNDAETEENLSIYPLDVQDVCQMCPQSRSMSSCRPCFISVGLSTTKNVQESKSERTDSLKVRHYELVISR